MHPYSSIILSYSSAQKSRNAATDLFGVVVKLTTARRMLAPRTDGLRKLALASALHSEMQRFISGVGSYKHRRSNFTLLLEQLEVLQDNASSPPMPGSPMDASAQTSSGVMRHDETLRAGWEGAGQAMSRARDALSGGASYVAVKGGII